MFLNPYDTTPCSAYRGKLNGIVGQLERIYLLGGFGLERITNDGGFMLTPNDPAVPPFAHPLPINTGKRLEYVIDVRPFTRLDSERNVVISSRLDHKVSVERNIMQSRWYTEGSQAIFTLGNFQVKAFGMWIGNALRLRFALDPDAVLRVQIAASYYYLCISDDTDADVYDEEAFFRICQLLGTIWHVSPDQVSGYIGEAKVLHTVHDLISTVIRISDSKRLERFNQVELYQVIGGSWFGGGNPRELIAIALEHPPTFAILIYNAMTEKGYQKSMLGQMLGRLDRDNEAKAYIHNVDYMLRG